MRFGVGSHGYFVLGTMCWLLRVGYFVLGTMCWLRFACWELRVRHFMLGTACWFCFVLCELGDKTASALQLRGRGVLVGSVGAGLEDVVAV